MNIETKILMGLVTETVEPNKRKREFVTVPLSSMMASYANTL